MALFAPWKALLDQIFLVDIGRHTIEIVMTIGRWLTGAPVRYRNKPVVNGVINVIDKVGVTVQDELQE